MRESIKYLRGYQTIPTTGYQTIPGFAMIPAEVLTDPELSGRDVKVYGFITLSRRGSYASVGGRRISEFVHANREDVRASVDALVKRGHVKVETGGKGKRLRFKLLSGWFTKAEIVDDPAKNAAFLPEKSEKKSCFQQCAQCRRPSKVLVLDKLCGTCHGREELAARIAKARLELGASATPEQLAAHLKNSKLVARIRRLLAA